MVVATCLPFVRSDHWAFRIFDFPRLQITVVCCVTVAVHWLIRADPGPAQKTFLLVLSTCAAYQLWRMWPYTPLHPKQVQRSEREHADRSLNLFISNVLMTNRDSARLRELIRRRDPDVILLVEADGWWEQELRELERTHPHLVKHAQGNTYGMLLYSRAPLIDAQLKFLVQDDVPSIHAEIELRSGDRINLHCLHPRPPAPGESSLSTPRDAELLLMAKRLEGQDVPSIVIGDLNDVAWSHTTSLFLKISGMLDPRIGRGFYSTFNANWPFVRFPLDHAFVSRHFRLTDFEVLPHMGSDHFPVFTRLCLSPGPGGTPNRTPPEPTATDEQEAAEKIARASEPSAQADDPARQ